jgi:hypothetical protein
MFAVSLHASSEFALHAYPIKADSKNTRAAGLPERKRSADIIDRCAEDGEPEAAADQ